MTNEKFLEIATIEIDKCNENMIIINRSKDWYVLKPFIMEFIKNMDELVEVFEMENGK